MSVSVSSFLRSFIHRRVLLFPVDFFSCLPLQCDQTRIATWQLIYLYLTPEERVQYCIRRDRSANATVVIVGIETIA